MEYNKYTFGFLFESIEDEKLREKLREILLCLNPKYMGFSKDGRNALLILWDDPVFDDNEYNYLIREILEHLFIKEGDVMFELSNNTSIRFIVVLSKENDILHLGNFDYGLLTALQASIELVQEEIINEIKSRFDAISVSCNKLQNSNSEQECILENAGNQLLFLSKLIKDKDSLRYLACFFKSSWRTWNSLLNIYGTKHRNILKIRQFSSAIEEDVMRIQKIDGFENSSIRKLFFPMGISRIFCVKNKKSLLVLFCNKSEEKEFWYYCSNDNESESSNTLNLNIFESKEDEKYLKMKRIGKIYFIKMDGKIKLNNKIKFNNQFVWMLYDQGINDIKNHLYL